MMILTQLEKFCQGIRFIGEGQR